MASVAAIVFAIFSAVPIVSADSISPEMQQFTPVKQMSQDAPPAQPDAQIEKRGDQSLDGEQKTGDQQTEEMCLLRPLDEFLAAMDPEFETSQNLVFWTDRQDEEAGNPEDAKKKDKVEALLEAVDELPLEPVEDFSGAEDLEDSADWMMDAEGLDSQDLEDSPNDYAMDLEAEDVTALNPTKVSLIMAGGQILVAYDSSFEEEKIVEILQEETQDEEREFMAAEAADTAEAIFEEARLVKEEAGETQDQPQQEMPGLAFFSVPAPMTIALQMIEMFLVPEDTSTAVTVEPEEKISFPLIEMPEWTVEESSLAAEVKIFETMTLAVPSFLTEPEMEIMTEPMAEGKKDENVDIDKTEDVTYEDKPAAPASEEIKESEVSAVAAEGGTEEVPVEEEVLVEETVTEEVSAVPDIPANDMLTNPAMIAKELGLIAVISEEKQEKRTLHVMEPVEHAPVEKQELKEEKAAIPDPVNMAKKMGLVADVPTMPEAVSETPASILTSTNPEIAGVMMTTLPSDKKAGAMELLTPEIKKEQKEIVKLIDPDVREVPENKKTEEFPVNTAFNELAVKMAMTSRPTEDSLTSAPQAGIFKSIVKQVLEPMLVATMSPVTPQFVSPATSNSSLPRYSSFESSPRRTSSFLEDNKFRFSSYSPSPVSYYRSAASSASGGIYRRYSGNSASYDSSRKKSRRYRYSG